jgi:hypothetical protein
MSFFERDCNLALNCFVTIENLFLYSSHDKQSALQEYLSFYFMKLKDLDKRTDINIHLIYYDLESHYTQIIRKIITKLLVPLQINDAKSLYEVIVQSFDRRGGVYDEGLLAISSMAISKYYEN